MLAIVIAAVIIISDQISKYFVIRDLKPVIDIPLWDGVFHLHYAQNTGGAFSILQNQQWIFYIFNTIAIFFILYMIFKEKKTLGIFGLVSLAMIMGGAIGNLIDRIRFGYVVDFLYFKLINFAIFNVADSCITIGSILLGIYVLFLYEKRSALQAPPAEHHEPAGSEGEGN